jgi:hypothetical protein
LAVPDERSQRSALLTFAALYALAAVAARRAMSRWGSTSAERARPLHGDDLVTGAGQQTHGITIAAPAAAVWPWLVQMGQGRPSFYFTVAEIEPECALVLYSTRHLLKPMTSVEFSSPWGRRRSLTPRWRRRGRNSIRRSEVPAVEPAPIAIFGGVVDPSKLRFPFKHMPASDARDWQAIAGFAASSALA